MEAKKIRKYALYAVGVLLLFAFIGKKAGWFGSKGATEVTVEKASIKKIVELVSASGKVQPEKEVKISPDVSGEIVELYVIEGQQIKKGDLLCKIRPDLYETAVNRVNAALNTSRANYANSKARLLQVQANFTNIEATYKRNQKLFDQGAISQQDFDQSKAAFESAKADIEAAEENVNAAKYTVNSSEASLKEANDNLSRTAIYAPVNGTISKLNVELGERVVGTSQMAGTEIMRIANLNEMEVSVDVNENDIVKVGMNDTAEIEVDAYIDRKFKGVVTEIANSANTTGISADQVTNFTVKIRILRESYEDLIKNKPSNFSPFRPGMSATVDVRTNTVSGVVAVPIQAVTTREDTVSMAKGKEVKKDERKRDDDGEEIVTDEDMKEKKVGKIQEFVFVNEAGIARLRKVKTGIQDNDNIQILEGLKSGEEIISGPYVAVAKQLKDGDKIEIVDKEELTRRRKEENK